MRFSKKKMKENYDVYLDIYDGYNKLIDKIMKDLANKAEEMNRELHKNVINREKYEELRQSCISLVDKLKFYQEKKNRLYSILEPLGFFDIKRKR